MSQPHPSNRKLGAWHSARGTISWPLGLLLACCAFATASLAADPPALIPDGKDFGAGLSLDQVVELESVVQHPERYSEGPILLRGRISDVCQRKGCWTVLSDGEHSARVRFKDYGFFLPTDCSGKTAYVEGVVKVEELSQRTAQHYADESKSAPAEKIVGPQKEVAITATGVRLIGLE